MSRNLAQRIILRPRRTESDPSGLLPSPIDCTTHPDTLRTLLARRSYLDLSGRVSEIGKQVGQGGFSDLFVGWLKLGDERKCKVAVKKLRAHAMGDGKFEKALARELYIWSKLKHRRILRLEGFYVDESGYPYLISRWMDHGTALSYLQTNPVASVLHLAVGIAEGIAYLHSRKIVHSDIKPDNVLISESGQPLLCDFGISRVIERTATSPINSTDTTGGGTVRYMARELLLGENTKHTELSDVWAFGMTVYTLLTRRPPYNEFASEVQVLLAIVDGKLPRWPEDVQAWPLEEQILSRMCQRCWDEPEVRPNIATIASELHRVRPTSGWRSVVPDVFRRRSSVSQTGRMVTHTTSVLNVSQSGSALVSPTDTSLPRKKCTGSGTATHTSSGSLTCTFVVDGYRLTFDASSGPGLPQFSCKDAQIYYDDADELTGTRKYSGLVGVDSYTLTLENGTIIFGCLDLCHHDGMNRIVGSGIWIST